MSSSTSSSDPGAWRRFFRLAAGTAAAAVAIVYAFVVIVDPFDTLPLSPGFDRAPVASNARFAFPALARSERFDSALFGTSTSRLLRPAALDPLFGTRMANLSMNDATVHEQLRLMRVFLHAHPNPRVIMLGMDVRWCVTGPDYQIYTPRQMPEWMYEDNLWVGYREMLNLYAIETAGQLFGILTGIKAETYGRDGYTRFVPPDAAYDREKVARNLRAAGPSIPPGNRSGPPETWRYPALDDLRALLADVPGETRVVLFFVPYHRVLQVSPEQEGAAVWAECKRRAATLAGSLPRGLAVDFMRPSGITTEDDHYWDALHFTTGIADRLAVGLAGAVRGERSGDYVVLGE